jgi:hypothetical protein
LVEAAWPDPANRYQEVFVQRNQRIALLSAAAVVIVVGLIIAISSGGSSKHTPTTRSAHVFVVGCKPEGGINKIDVHQNDTLNLAVSSDCADEIHVHGYNYHKTVPANGTVNFNFKATITGTFVIELESRSEQIASLSVNT